MEKVCTEEKNTANDTTTSSCLSGLISLHTSSFFLGSASWFRNSGESPYGEYARILSCCWRTACCEAAAFGSVSAGKKNS